MLWAAAAMPRRDVVPDTALLDGEQDASATSSSHAQRGRAGLRWGVAFMRLICHAACLMEVAVLVALVVRIFAVTTGLQSACNSVPLEQHEPNATTAPTTTGPSATASASGNATATAAGVGGDADATTGPAAPAGPAADCASTYLLAYSALLLVVCCCIVLPYAAQLGARTSALLQHARLGTPLRASALRTSPAMAVLLAFGGWLAIAALVVLDVVACAQGLVVLCARTRHAACGGPRHRAAGDRRVLRCLSDWLHRLDRSLDIFSADALVMQRCAAQAVYCSLPSFVACVTSAASPFLRELWAGETGYYDGDGNGDGGASFARASWDPGLLHAHLLAACACSGLNLVLQWLHVALDARALNTPAATYVPSCASFHGLQK